MYGWRRLDGVETETRTNERATSFNPATKNSGSNVPREKGLEKRDDPKLRDGGRRIKRAVEIGS